MLTGKLDYVGTHFDVGRTLVLNALFCLSATLLLRTLTLVYLFPLWRGLIEHNDMLDTGTLRHIQHNNDMLDTGTLRHIQHNITPISLKSASNFNSIIFRC